ncbi:MAG: pyridoxal phosphate-dependent decarboxylase family protein [Pelagimonas sp.]|uniref:pyridoxal phosphate-dependent decarboxylase family protein n=1 Tax=Pelagimonas sp. TaxID=2073170 RepID=UPI003D6BF422
MDPLDFEKWSNRAAQWGVDYRKTLRDRPVRAQTPAGSIYNAIPSAPPETSEDMDAIFDDFENLILPGMTHWQHPRFFAYFPANAAPVSVIAEYLVSAMAAQCMLWQTSPAATELETRMMEWLGTAIGLPETFTGVIQDSASSATLAAVLVMRERALNWQGNIAGLKSGPQLRIYCSGEVHTSIDRALWVSGIGSDNLVRIPTKGPMRSMDPAALDAAIKSDIAAGLTPAGVIACTGGTSTGSCDDLRAVIRVAKSHDLFTHIDAAWAGAAMICPEFRPLWDGVEAADSIVFNPHKWLGAQFDCSAHFLRDPDLLVKTLAIQPEYLKTHGQDGIINYSEWSVPLGRRFRALKLWFLMRFHGIDGLRSVIRNHVDWSVWLADHLRETDGFEIVTDPILSLFSFRLTSGEAQTQALLETINADGEIYLTQTRVNGTYAIRFQAGAFDMRRDDIEKALKVITQTARRL